MRISDWSSDVCSSDLAFVVAMVDISGSMNCSVNPNNSEESMFSRLDLVKHTLKTFVTCLGPEDFFSIVIYDDIAEVNIAPTLQIGRASCRESACQHVLYAVGDGS